MVRTATAAQWREALALRDTCSLGELASRLDCTPGEVAAALKRAGALGPVEVLPPEPGEADIAPQLVLDTATPLPPKVRPGSKDRRLAALHDLLGQVPDAEVAREAGVSVRTVASYRARHQIAGYRGPRRRRSAATMETADAWSVTTRSDSGLREVVVVATSLDDALARVRETTADPVVALRLVGPVWG